MFGSIIWISDNVNKCGDYYDNYEDDVFLSIFYFCMPKYLINEQCNGDINDLNW